jgi:hypothetical protein
MWHGVGVWAPTLNVIVEFGDAYRVIRALDSGVAAFVLFPRTDRWPTEVWLYVFRSAPRSSTYGL